MKAAIFDRDGVLTSFDPISALDYINQVLPISLDELLATWQAWGKVHGFPSSEEEEKTFFDGMWSELALKFGLGDAEAVWLRAFDYTRHMIVYPDAVPTLCALRAAGFKIGVLSNFSLATLDRSLTALGLDGLVNVACAATVIGVSKPDARAYLTICTMLDVAPADSLFFDDEPDCVKGGQLVGMQSFLVDRAAKRSDFDGPRITSLSEIITLLARFC